MTDDLLNGFELADDECVVALADNGTAWILARSYAMDATDLMPEPSTEDNGFDAVWDRNLTVGVYRLKVKPWSHQGYEGEWDCGVDVLKVTPLWVAEPAPAPTGLTVYGKPVDTATRAELVDALTKLTRVHNGAMARIVGQFRTLLGGRR